MELKNNQKKDVKVLLYIQQTLDETLFLRIKEVKKAEQMWKILWDELEGSDKVNTFKL